MESIEEKIAALLEEIKKVPDGNYKEQFRLQEKVIEYYQVLNNKQGEFEMRHRMIRDLGKYDLEKMLLYFSPMLQYHDLHFEELSEKEKDNVIQDHIRVVGALYESVKIKKQQITMLWEDLLQRAMNSSANFSFMSAVLGEKTKTKAEKMAIIYYRGWNLYARIGERKKANELYEYWCNEFSPKGFQFSECAACVLNREVATAMLYNDFPLTISAGEKLVNNKEIIFCGFVPADTHSHIAEAYFSMSDFKNAEKHLEDARKGSKPKTIDVIWYARLKEFGKALEVFEEVLKEDFNNIDADILKCCHTGYLLFKAYEEEKGNTDLAMNLPDNLPFYKDNHCYDISGLKNGFHEISSKLINEFDKRNENSMISDFYNRRENLLKI